MLRGEIWHPFLEMSAKSERLSEIKPPLVITTFCNTHKAFTFMPSTSALIDISTYVVCMHAH